MTACDALIALDEAHLSEPFLDLIKALRKRGHAPGLHAVGVSASLRDADAAGIGADGSDAEPDLRERLNARKRIVRRPKSTALEQARKQAGRGRRTIVVVDLPRDAQAIAAAIAEENGTEPILITGQQRTKERLEAEERLRAWKTPARAGETGDAWLIGTSAIEVGIDASGDTLITEPTDAVGIQQRAGRLKRAGEPGEGELILVGRPEGRKEPKGEAWADRRRAETKTAAWLKTKKNAGPADLADAPDEARCRKAVTVPLIDADIRRLACTTRPGAEPRIPIDVLIHGIGGIGLETVEVAAREELDEVEDAITFEEGDATAWPRGELEAWWKNHRIHPLETAAVPIAAATEWLRERLHEKTPVVEVRYGRPVCRTAGEYRRTRGEGPAARLQHGTMLALPARWLDIDGHGTVRCRWRRVEKADGKRPEPADASCCAGTGRTKTLIEERAGNAYQAVENGPWRRIDSGYGTGRRRPRYARQTMKEHRAAVEAATERMISRLDLNGAERQALREFAKWHDDGKEAEEWKEWMGGSKEEPLAHGGNPKPPAELHGFRHELESAVKAETAGASELGLALILQHHGWGRPWMSPRAAGRVGDRESRRRMMERAPLIHEAAERALGPYRFGRLAAAAAAIDIEGTPKRNGTRR